MKIYLIRHAQAEHNVNGNIGLFDPSITQFGKQQCNNKKHLYNDVKIVISSTSTRALQTTELLFKDLDVKVYATDILLEYNTGVACNKRNTIEHQKLKFDNIDFDTYLSPELSLETTWSDGETRAKKVIELLKTIDTPVVAIVSHANFIRNIMCAYNSTMYNKEELENCGSYIITL
jgi:broad specificity phosphatase PhoE